MTYFLFFFKQKTAYEMRISDWSSDVCSSDLLHGVGISVVNALSDRLDVEVVIDQQLYTQSYSRGTPTTRLVKQGHVHNRRGTKITFHPDAEIFGKGATFRPSRLHRMARSKAYLFGGVQIRWHCAPSLISDGTPRSEEHTSELQSLMRISSAVFCLKKN